MLEILSQWGTEILFALISAAILGWAKWRVNTARKEKEQSDENAKLLREQKISEKIDVKLEPIYEELEELRRYIRDTETIEKSHMALILASYRFRLVQLCKCFLNQGYITMDQRTQLDEFYKVYTGLGGNGQAKILYEQCISLPHEP